MIQINPILPTKEDFITLKTASEYLAKLCHNDCDHCFIGRFLDGEPCPVSTANSVTQQILDELIDKALSNATYVKTVKNN